MLMMWRNWVEGEGEDEEVQPKYCYIIYVCVCGARRLMKRRAFDKQQGRERQRERKKESLRHGAIGEMECEENGVVGKKMSVCAIFAW